MDQYLENLEVFYDEKMKYLTKRNKFINCQTCDTEKNFKESKEELILSCGSGKDDECGDQIIIKLPKYIHYETKLKELKDSFNEEYNWETLQRFFEVSEKVKDSEKRQEGIHKEIQRIEDLFLEKNMILKKEQIQIFYDQRIKETKECKQIMKELNKTIDDKEKRDTLRRKYIEIVIKLNEDYTKIQELIKDKDKDQFLMDEGPDVTIKHNNYEYKKVKKKSSEREEDDHLIEKVLNAFHKNDGILTKEEFLRVKKGFKTKWGNELFRHLLGPIEHGFKKKEQAKFGPIIEKPTSNDTDSIKLSKNWRKLLLKELEVGMKVSWLYKNVKKYGIIQKIEGLKITIKDDRGKERFKEKKRLLIEDLD